MTAHSSLLTAHSEQILTKNSSSGSIKPSESAERKGRRDERRGIEEEEKSVDSAVPVWGTIGSCLFWAFSVCCRLLLLVLRRGAHQPSEGNLDYNPG